MKELLYGAAYYDEYMPEDRIDEDIRLMKKAGMNLVRIAESTWSTCEPQPGVFDFSHVIRVLDKMEEAGINVIVGTPTYAVPSWMEKMIPEIIADTHRGRPFYGHRQIMDITHPAYLFYAERVIRKLMEVTAERKCVIGFQLDNETKYYDTAGKNVRQQFIKHLRNKFHNDLDEMNRAFGLDYWSNRVDAWEDFPDVRGTINGSLKSEFDKFRRTLVTDFLQWQSDIVSEYKREDQFITHNLDYEWRGHSYGLQPYVDHFKAAKALTLAGTDIYHPSQDRLTGEEIAFAGDITRSLKKDNYIVLETEAQGYPDWTPFEGQLRLQAYSHLASGSNGVEYWHWHSIHNSAETYWKGVLSHDLKENAILREAAVVGQEWHRIGDHLINLKKHNKVAVLLSNEALTAIENFPIDATAGNRGTVFYNDVFRWLYKALYRMNVECDMLFPESENFEDYDLILVPALYSAPESLLLKLKDYVEEGGCLAATFKTAFTDENVKVFHDTQPHILRECLGVSYQEFSLPGSAKLKSSVLKIEEGERPEMFMELLYPEGAEEILSYDHPSFGKYAAVTRNTCKKGTAWYLGCGLSEELLKKVMREILKDAEIPYPDDLSFPVIIKKGINDFNKEVTYLLNYSGKEMPLVWKGNRVKDLLCDKIVSPGDSLCIGPWNLLILEEV